jgi:aspartate aminotransferase
MPSVSIKGKSMPASPIRKLAPYADAAKNNGIKIYHLNIGQPDIETPYQFWDAMRNIDRKVLEYSPSDGFEALKVKTAAFYQDRYALTHIYKDDILICTGASEALFYTFLSILDEGEEIIIPEPLYANYIGFSKGGNIGLKPIVTSFENNFALPSVEEFEKTIGPKTKAILICNPNNPTGYCYTKEELDRIAKIALQHNLFIISDEVYRDFVYSDVPYTSMLTYPELSQHVIMVDSLSKRFSACGARIGMIFTKNHEVLQTVLKFAQQRLSPPTVEQLSAISLYDVEDDYFINTKNEYRHRRDTLVNALNAIPGVKCNLPAGAFYTMVQLPVDDAEDFCIWMLKDFNYKGTTTMMSPGNGFYATPNMGKNEVRIAYVLKPEEIIDAVNCIAKGLDAYKAIRGIH